MQVFIKKRKKKHIKKRTNLYAANTKWIEYIEYFYLDHVEIPQNFYSPCFRYR